MRIVLDTTEVVADFYLSGTAFRVLADCLERLSATLVVPAVVVDEATAKYEEQVRILRSEADRFSHKFERLFQQRIAMPLEYIDKIASFYAGTLRGALFNFPAEVAAYPLTTHSDLVKRAARRRKPFNDTGSGYRDALIWDTVLGLVRESDETICFVSRNTRDFGASPNLHPDLVSDLTALGRRFDCVKLFNSIEELNQQLVLPTLIKLDDLAVQLEDDSTPAGTSFHLWLMENLEIELAMLLETPLSPLAPDHVKVGSPQLKKLYGLAIDDVRLLPNGRQMVVSCTSKLEANVSVDITWEQYERYPDVREFLGEGEEPFGSMWTDSDVWATVELSLIVDIESYAVDSCEVDGLYTDHMSEEFNPHVGR